MPEGIHSVAAPRSAQGGRRHSLALAISLLLSVVAYVSVYHSAAAGALGPLRNLCATLLASVPFAVALFTTARLHRPQLLHWLLFAVGTVLLRLCIPLSLVEGSDDVFRYLWDGYLQNNSINPYVFAPDAAAISQFRDAALSGNIFRPEMKTVYPPLAQLWFALSHRIFGTSIAGLKLCYLLNDMASVYLLVLLLHRRGLPPLLALAYGWSPLCIVQLFAGCHLDGLLIPWLLLAVLLHERRPILSGFSLGCATVVRPTTGLALPTLALRRPRKETLAVLGGFAAASLAIAAPYLRAGRHMIESLTVYGTRWQFNGSLYRMLAPVFARFTGFRPMLYGLIASLAVFWGSMSVPHIDTLTRTIFSLGGYFALAPTVYPWYLTPFAALGAPYAGLLVATLPAIITLSDLVFVDGQVGGRWQVPTLPLVVEYGLLYGLLALEVLLRRLAEERSRQQPPSAGQPTT